MPYTSIHFVKLYINLLDEDDRFLYQLNESQQLLYLKMLMLAGMTNNKIPKKERFIFHKINYGHDEDCFHQDIQRISEVFPRLIIDEDYYYFNNFEQLHNYIPKSGNPKEIPRISHGYSQNKNKNKNKNKNIGQKFNKPDLQTIKNYCKERQNAIIAENFFDYYEANGWKVGKNPMKDWKAAIRTWERNTRTQNNTGKEVRDL